MTLLLAVNPYAASETLVIDEREPVTNVTSGVRAIIVRPTNRLGKWRVAASALQAIFDALPNPAEVRLFEVDYDSRLAVLPDLARFENLEEVYIAGRNVREYSALHECRNIRKLLLVSYRHSDLDALASKSFDTVRFIRGQLAALKVSASFALLQSCSNLADLSGSTIDYLIVEACNRLDFQTLTRVNGLTRLDLLACRGLTEFSWLERCPSLKRLVVTATSASRLDLSSLQGTTADELFLAIPEPMLVAVSKMMPHATVSNGEVWLRAGVPGVGDNPLSTQAERG